MANDITIKVGVDSGDAEKGLNAIVQEASKAADSASQSFSGIFDGLDSSLGDVKKSITGLPDIGDALASDIPSAKNALNSFVDEQRQLLVALRLQGKEGSESYSQIEKAIIDAKQELQKMDDATAAVEQSLTDIGNAGQKSGGLLAGLGESLKGAFSGGALDAFIGGGAVAAITAGAGAIVDGLGSAIEAGRGLISAQGDLQAQTGATGAEFEALKKEAEDAFLGGVGESVAEATKVISNAKVVLKDALPVDQIGDFTAKAQALGNLYDKDVNEVIAKSAPFIKQFGLNGDEAFNLIAFAAKEGKTSQDDVLDTLAEYSQLLQEAGFSAEEFASSMAVAGQEGLFNTDKIADSIKEAQIRLKAGDTAKAFTDIKNQLPAALGDTLGNLEKLASSGQITIKDFLSKSGAAIKTAFDSGQISEAMASQLQVAVAGTPAEDIGVEAYNKLFGAPIPIEEIKKRAAEAGQTASGAVGQYLSFDAIGRNLALAFEKGSAEVTKVIDDIARIVIPIFTETLAPVFDNFSNTFSGAFERGWSVIQPILALIGGAIIANVVQILNAAMVVVDTFYRIWTSAFDAITNAFKPLVDALKQAFGIDGEMAKGVGVVDTFKNALGLATEVVKEIGLIVAEFGGLVIEYLITPIQLGIEVIADITRSIAGWMSSNDENTKSIKGTGEETQKAKGFVDTLRNAFDNIRGTIGGVREAFTQIKITISEFWDAITQFDLKKALEAFTGFGDKLSDAYDRGFNKTKDAIKNTNDAQKEADAEQKKRDEDAKAKADADAKAKAKADADAKAGAKANTNEQLKLIDELLAKSEEVTREERQKFIESVNYRKLTKDEELNLLKAEEARISAILSQGGKLVDLKGKEYKSLVDIGKITVDASGAATSSIKGTKEEIAKAVDQYQKVDKQLLDIRQKIAESAGNAGAEQLKNELEDLKKSSESLRKSIPEKLTTQYAFTVDAETYEKEITTAQNRFAELNQRLKTAELSADAKQREEITKQLEQNLKVQEQIQKEYANIVERIKIESIEDGDKRRLEIALFDLRVKFEAEQEANKGNNVKLREIETAYLTERARLQDEYDRQTNVLLGVQMAIQSAMSEQFNINRLMEERKANEEIRKAKLEAFEEEESDLETSLANREISFEEYQARIAEIQQRRIDEGVDQEKLGEQLLQNVKIAGDKALSTILTDQGNKLTAAAQERATKQIALDAKVAEQRKALEDLKGQETTQKFIDAQKELEKAQTAAAQNDADVYGFRTSILEEFAGKAMTQFATMAASGKATLADVGKVTLQLAFELLQKQIPIWVASIFGTEVSKMGIGGIATASILTGALYGLFAAAQSAAGFKDGVIALEGEGTETSDSIPAWLSKGESVITARATKNNIEELKFMNDTGLPIREFYKMQMSHTTVNEEGQLVHEIRALRQTTENLGVQITRNTKVDVHGVLHADGNSITAMIEANRKKNSRRF